MGNSGLLTACVSEASPIASLPSPRAEKQRTPWRQDRLWTSFALGVVVGAIVGGAAASIDVVALVCLSLWISYFSMLGLFWFRSASLQLWFGLLFVVARLVGWLVGWVGSLVGWLAHWFVGWLIAFLCCFLFE